MLLVACSSTSDGSRESAPTSTSAVTVVEPDATYPVAPTSRFGNFAVSPGTVDAEALDSIELDLLDGVPVDVQALTSGCLDFGVAAKASGPLGGSVRLTLPIEAPPSDDSVPGVLHLRDDGTYALIPALYDDSTGTVSVWVDSFSNFFSGWWNPFNWVEEAIRIVGGAVDFIADWVTGRSDPPRCNNEAPDWGSVTVVEAASLHVCVQANARSDGTERVEVFIKSNRSTMQAVTIPTGVDYLWVESQPDFFRPVSSAIAADISFGTPIEQIVDIQSSPQIVTLFGGESMSFGFTRPTGDIDVEIRAFMSEGQIVANHLLGLIGGLEGDDVLMMTLATYACTANISGIDLPAVSSPPTSIPEAIEVGTKCGLTLLSEPEIMTGVIGTIAEELGFDANEFTQFVASKLGGSTQQLAKRLLSAINVTGAAVRVFDGIFDSVAEGLITLRLESPPPRAPEAPPREPKLDSCEGLDTSPAVFTAVTIVDSVCAWPWSLVAFTEPHPRLSVMVLYQEQFPSESKVYFTDVQASVEVSTYTPEAIVEHSGMPLATAQLLYDALGGPDAGNSSGTTADSTGARPSTEVAPCVASGVISIGMDGPNPEVALLQTRLTELGYNPGDIDGYFGESTWGATVVSQVQYSDGTSGGNGVFADEQTLLEPVFERLNISCEMN